MRFIKILRYDFNNGFVKNLWKQAICIGLLVAFMASFWLKVNEYIIFNGINSWKEINISSSDIALYCFGGMLRFVPENATPFHLPTMWLMLTTGICYLTLQYPYRDISHTGIQVVIRSGGKVRWWFSKCAWNTATIFFSFVIIHLGIIAICIFVGIPLSLNVDTSLSQGMYGLGDFNVPDWKSILCFIYVLPMVVSAVISILQMMLSLILKPFIAFVCICVLWISNVYFYSPYLVGNYAMPLRANIFGNGSLQYQTGIALCVIIYALLIGAGAVIMKRYEMLSLEK